MQWTLALVSLGVIGVAAISRRLSGTPVTPAMLFVAFGVLAGPQVLGGIDLESTGGAVRTLAEATLTLVLFCDAARIDMRQLRRDIGLPLRLLGVGLPLMIAIGALVAAIVLPQLTAAEPLVLAVILAPTDAALGEAVVVDNDGIKQWRRPRFQHRCGFLAERDAFGLRPIAVGLDTIWTLKTSSSVLVPRPSFRSRPRTSARQSRGGSRPRSRVGRASGRSS